MMPLPHQHTRDLARRVAQHEMGHYVISNVLGFDTGDVELEIFGDIEGHRGAAGTKLPQSLTTTVEVAEYLAKRVQILYAGAQAETLEAHTAPIGKVNVQKAIDIIRHPKNGSEQDQAKARELIHILRSIRHHDTDLTDETSIQAQLDAIDAELWDKTTRLVEDNANTIVGLAANLAHRVDRLRTPVVLTAAELELLPAVAALKRSG